MLEKNIYEEMADKRVELAMEQYKTENNAMSLFCSINGLGVFKLEISPDSGHNYYYILEAIYRYHQKFPQDGIDKYMQTTLLFQADIVSDIISINNFLNVVLAQLKNQKDNVSTFKIDFIPILETFKNNIKNNKELHNGIILNKIGEYDKYLAENFGYKIL